MLRLINGSSTDVVRTGFHMLSSLHVIRRVKAVDSGCRGAIDCLDFTDGFTLNALQVYTELYHCTLDPIE